MLIDIGANLTHDSFHPDFEDVLARARDAGIRKMIVTGASVDGSEDAVALAHEHPGFLYATAGIHPHHASDATPGAIAKLAALHRDPAVVAVGETGLDFFRDFSPRDDQVRSFEAHIELAIASGLPMFLHERDAYPRFAQVLHAYRDRLGDVVVHCFTGERDALYAYLDMDCHIGITGWICDERRGTHLIPLVKDIPPARLMIETDAPYLMPRNIRPRPKTNRNEPHYLPYVCRFVADVLKVDYNELAARTSDNATRFFRLSTNEAG
ncbi:MAG: TatD family hydrolase [Pseudomonadales bacterium]|nr:TatD family hydrolase [Pseudomonadales bacterium]